MFDSHSGAVRIYLDSVDNLESPELELCSTKTLSNEKVPYACTYLVH